MPHSVEHARRQHIGVRLAPSALAEVDRIAATNDWSRSQVLRDLLRLGLDAWRAGAR